MLWQKLVDLLFILHTASFFCQGLFVDFSESSFVFMALNLKNKITIQ